MKIGQIIGFGVLGAFLTLPAATGLFADGGDTTLIHACVATDGTMRIVSPTTACKKNETPLHWATTARVSAIETKDTSQDSAISAAQTKNNSQDSSISAIQTKDTQQDAAIAALQSQGSGSGLVVKDSQGQVVGKAQEVAGTSIHVFRRIDNVPVYFFVTPTGLLNFGGVDFAYTTNNCTGTRYLVSAEAGQFSTLLISTDGQTWYYPTSPTQQLSIQSFEDFQPGENPSGVGACYPIDPTPFIVGTVSTISAASLGVPPFHLE